MGSKYAAQLLVFLLAAASMAAVGSANKNATVFGSRPWTPKNVSSASWWWNPGFNFTDWWSRHLNATTGNNNGPNKIIVGGSENWHFGFNYTDWAIKTSPFYVNDILVFKYNAPKGPDDHPHSVYMFPNYWSWLSCDLSKAKRLADPTQGEGQGFEFALNRWQPYYFACGESKGIHCNLGMMKFAVMPMFRRWY